MTDAAFYTEIDAFIRENRENILRDIRRICAVPSVNGPAEEGKPFGAGPAKALDTALTIADEMGLHTNNCEGYMGYASWGQGTEYLATICHLDVVPAGEGWDSDPFVLTFKNDAMYGRGIIDDKGPAAASFFAMKALLDEGKIPSDYRVRLIVGTDEERTASCIEHYVENDEVPAFSITPDAEFPVIFSEKSIFHVKIVDKNGENLTACGGSAVNMVPAKASCVIEGQEFKANGKPAHAARTDLGINAIEVLARTLHDSGIDLEKYPLLKFIHEFKGKEFTGCLMPDESGSLTSNIGLLKIDDEECSIIIDFRVPIGYDLDDVFRNLSRKATQYGLEATIDSALKGIYTDKNDPSVVKLTDIWSKHMSRLTGFTEGYREKYTDAVAIGGGTYAKFIPNTVAYGLQAPWHADQCHQANEYAAVSDFLEWIEIMKEVIESFN